MRHACRSRLIWAAALAVAWTSCLEPEPQTLTLPTLADEDRQVRKAMVEFNEARFQEERTAIVAAIRQTPFLSDTLRGGVVLQRLPQDSTKSTLSIGLDDWRAEAGDRVVWTWEAFTLDGKSLTAGQDEFEVERGAVPQAFHEAAKQLGHFERADVWTPSLSAFGVRGIPGEIPPYMPLRLRVEQFRSIQDTAWWSAIQGAKTSEAPWLATFLKELTADSVAQQITEGVWLQVHSARRESLTKDQTLSLRIRTSACVGDFERETPMEWRLGTQDQLVPALERAVLHSRQAERFTVWSVSGQAFGSQGSSRAGIPPRTPLRFDVEVIPL